LDSLLWSQIGLMALGLLLIYLSYRFDLEPLLLIPIGFFMFMVNIPNSPLAEQGGLMDQMFNALIKTELLPLIIFIGVGAMMDFGPLIANPSYMILGLFFTTGHIHRIFCCHSFWIRHTKCGIHSQHWNC